MVRIAWFSPLFVDSPHAARALAGANFSRAILPLLPTDWEIELFVDDTDWRYLRSSSNSAALSFAGRPVWSYQKAFLRHREKPFQTAIFQLEDDPKYWFIQRQLRLWPGLVFFHDVNLNKLYRSQFRHSTGGTDINAEMDELFGANSPRLGDWQVRGWSADALDREYVRGEKEWRSAGVALASQPFAAQQLQKSGIPAHTFQPVLALPPLANAAARRSARERLNLGDEEFLLVLAPENYLADRVELALQIGQALGEKCNIRLLWLAFGSDELQWAKRYAERKAFDFLRVQEVRDEQGFLEFLPAGDAFWGLRADLGRGVLPGVWQAMGFCLPVFVFDDGASADIPVEACCQLELGKFEVESAFLWLEKLCSSPQLRRAIGEQAREYVRQHLAAATAAEQLVDLLQREQAFLGQKFAQAEQRLAATRDTLLSYAGQQLKAVLPGDSATATMSKAIADFGWEVRR